MSSHKIRKFQSMCRKWLNFICMSTDWVTVLRWCTIDYMYSALLDDKVNLYPAEAILQKHLQCNII